MGQKKVSAIQETLAENGAALQEHTKDLELVQGRGDRTDKQLLDITRKLQQQSALLKEGNGYTSRVEDHGRHIERKLEDEIQRVTSLNEASAAKMGQARRFAEGLMNNIEEMKTSSMEHPELFEKMDLRITNLQEGEKERDATLKA